MIKIGNYAKIPEKVYVLNTGEIWFGSVLSEGCGSRPCLGKPYDRCSVYCPRADIHMDVNEAGTPFWIVETCGCKHFYKHLLQETRSSKIENREFEEVPLD